MNSRDETEHMLPRRRLLEALSHLLLMILLLNTIIFCKQLLPMSDKIVSMKKFELNCLVYSS